MNVTRTLTGLVGSLLAVAAFSGAAGAATLELNGTGSSAGRAVMGYAPVEMCDVAYNAVTNPITHYKSPQVPAADHHVWTCKLLSGDDLIVRYRASGSIEGFTFVQSGASTDIMNHLTSTCGAATHITVGAKEWDEITCGTVVTSLFPVNFGGSDVQAPSFGQVGPVNSGCPTSGSPIVPPILGGAPCTAPVPVAPGVTAQGGPIVPFAVIVGNGVQKWDPVANTVIGKVGSLSRDMIESIFRKEVTDWNRVGLATAPPCTAAGVPHAGCLGIGIAPAGTAADATSPIDLCERSAGSGSKASIQRTLMLLSNEATVASGAFTAGADTAFARSSSGVITCLTNNPNGIGYQDADSVPTFPTINPTPRAYPVKINGFAVSEMSYDAGPVTPLPGSATVENRKLNLRCGQYPFWVQLQLTRPTAAFGDARDAAFAAFITAAQGQTLIDQLKGDPLVANTPIAGHFWVSGTAMAVTKNTDRGPILWKAGDHSECSVTQ